MSELIRAETAPIVYTRKNWSDPWTERPYLFCERVEFTLGSIGSAQFVWHYGSVGRSPSDYQEIAALELKDHWVKVVITPTNSDVPTMVWYGVFAVSTLNILGGNQAFMTGDQRLIAYSFEYLLTKIQLTQSLVHDPTDFELEGRWVATAIDFNAFKSDRARSRVQFGNRSPSKFMFSNDLKTAVTWTARDILRYLVLYCINFENEFLPKPLTMPEINDRFPDDMDFFPGEVSVAGRTVYDILDTLFSPQRGLSWKISPFDPPEEVYVIDIVSTSDETIDLPQGTIVANPDVISINAHEARDLQLCELTEDLSRRVDRVIVEGGLIGSVFTLAPRDSNLVKDWTAQDETDYRTGVSDQPGYAALDLSSQKSHNDHLRMNDRLRHVFTRFRVVDDWDGEVLDGQGGTFDLISNGTFPWPTDQLAVTDSSGRQYPLWQTGMTFMPYLPIKTRVDASQIDDQNPPRSLGDYRRPFAVVLIPNVGWIDLEAGYSILSGDEIINYDLSAHVHVHDHQLGLSVIPNRASHALTNSITFDGLPIAGHGAASHLLTGSVDWNLLAATVYARCPNHVRIQWPPTPVTPATDLNTMLTLRVGDLARLDYIIKNTITDVQDFLLVRAGATAAIRDDRDLMLDLAKRAWLYYKKPRVGVGLSYTAILDLPYVGQMIDWVLIGRPTYVKSATQGTIVFSTGTTSSIRMKTQAGVLLCLGTKKWITAQSASVPGATKKFLKADAAVKPVNTVVSRVVHDFTDMRTQVQTAFTELDLLGAFADAAPIA